MSFSGGKASGGQQEQPLHVDGGTSQSRRNRRARQRRGDQYRPFGSQDLYGLGGQHDTAESFFTDPAGRGGTRDAPIDLVFDSEEEGMVMDRGQVTPRDLPVRTSRFGRLSYGDFEDDGNYDKKEVIVIEDDDAVPVISEPGLEVPSYIGNAHRTICDAADAKPQAPSFYSGENGRVHPDRVHHFSETVPPARRPHDGQDEGHGKIPSISNPATAISAPLPSSTPPMEQNRLSKSRRGKKKVAPQNQRCLPRERGRNQPRSQHLYTLAQRGGQASPGESPHLSGIQCRTLSPNQTLIRHEQDGIQNTTSTSPAQLGQLKGRPCVPQQKPQTPVRDEHIALLIQQNAHLVQMQSDISPSQHEHTALTRNQLFLPKGVNRMSPNGQLAEPTDPNNPQNWPRLPIENRAIPAQTGGSDYGHIQNTDPHYVENLEDWITNTVDVFLTKLKRKPRVRWQVTPAELEGAEETNKTTRNVLDPDLMVMVKDKSIEHVRKSRLTTTVMLAEAANAKEAIHGEVDTDMIGTEPAPDVRREDSTGRSSKPPPTWRGQQEDVKPSDLAAEFGVDKNGIDFIHFSTNNLSLSSAFANSSANMLLDGNASIGPGSN